MTISIYASSNPDAPRTAWEKALNNIIDRVQPTLEHIAPQANITFRNLKAPYGLRVDVQSDINIIDGHHRMIAHIEAAVEQAVRDAGIEGATISVLPESDPDRKEPVSDLQMGKALLEISAQLHDEEGLSGAAHMDRMVKLTNMRPHIISRLMQNARDAK